LETKIGKFGFSTFFFFLNYKWIVFYEITLSPTWYYFLFFQLFSILCCWLFQISNQFHRLAYNHMFFLYAWGSFCCWPLSESTDIGCAPVPAGIKRPGKMAIGRGIELDVDTRVFR
jgi:hypothetical protein